MIRVAFRLGVLVDEVSQNLQPRSVDDGPGDSWAYVVPDLTAEDAQKELDIIQGAGVRITQATWLSYILMPVTENLGAEQGLCKCA